MALTRREFVAASLAFAATNCLGDEPALPMAAVGGTGCTVPRLGLGCFPLGNLADDAAALSVLQRAMSVGVRYLDTAPSYANGVSERRVGEGLKRWLSQNPAAGRGDFYIATKTLHRDGDKARAELEASLKRLRLEYVDCVQCHEVHDDWESLFSRGGVLEALAKAREEKLVRHIGITGHRNPKWLIECVRRMPPGADGRGIVSALVPVNPVEVQRHSFIREFLPVAEELGVAVIAMKIFGGGFLAQGKSFTVEELVRYAAAQKGVSVVVPGCDAPEQVDADAAAMRNAAPPDQAWLAAMEARAPKHEGKSTEWYKDE